MPPLTLPPIKFSHVNSSAIPELTSPNSSLCFLSSPFNNTIIIHLSKICETKLCFFILSSNKKIETSEKENKNRALFVSVSQSKRWPTPSNNQRHRATRLRIHIQSRPLFSTRDESLLSTASCQSRNSYSPTRFKL